MAIPLLRLALASAIAASALAQNLVTIPGHAAIYNGYTRGYTFTSATNFIIAQLGLPPDAMQAGDTAGFLVRKNGVVALHSIGNAGPNIATAILVNNGDVIDVMGNWSPAVPGNFTAHNSYGNTAPYATTIEGVPHTLSRSGWQWDISDPAYTSGTFLAPTTGQLGRVNMWTTPQSGLFANFTATPTAGALPLAVNFTDATFSSDPGGVTGWAWDFDGDNVIDSNLQNPSFVYNTCGSYNVTLTVTDASHAPSTLTRPGFIQAGISPITPSFTFAPIGPGLFQFTDTSTPTPASWAWDLDGDNIIDSTQQNPVWFYPSPCQAVRVTLGVSSNCAGPWSTSKSLVVSPNAHTTLLTGGNGLSAVGSGNTFDVQVTNPSGVVICAISMCPYMATPVLGAPIGCTVWVTDAAGGFLSNHTNAAVWRQVATGTGTFQGGLFSAPVPVPMTLSTPIYLPAGTYGMAIHMTTGCGVAYTTLTATTTYAGPDMNITCGNGKGSPFATGANANRAWNGTLHYSTMSNGQLAGYGFFGAGCAGSLGISRLSTSGPPVLGSSMTVTANNLPQSIAIMMTGFSRTVSPFGPLPISATPFGAPGCLGRVSPDVTTFLFGASNTAPWVFNIPNFAGLIGLELFNQPLSLDPGFNALGGTFGDAHAMVLGN